MSPPSQPGTRRGPDFLCIGMQKAGTGWLYDALIGMPRVSAHPIKEFHHFDYRLANTETDAEQHAARLRRGVAKYGSRLNDPERMKDVAARLERYLDAGCPDEAYLDLFATPEGQIAGDFTPAYSMLDEAAVRKVHAVLPDAKILLLVRNPIDRAWSQYNVTLRREVRAEGGRKRAGVQAEMNRRASLEHLEAFLETPAASRRSFPSRVHEAWSAVYPDLHVIGFDDIAKRPEQVRTYLCDNILPPGSEPSTPTVGNRKAGFLKVKKTPAHRDFLAAYFADEIARCRDIFPTLTREWSV